MSTVYRCLALRMTLIVGAAAGPVRASSCDAFVGKWAWFAGGVVTVTADGNFSQQSGNSGTWKCQEPSRGIVSLRWRTGGFVNTLVLSSDGQRLTSADPAQSYVTATRIAAGAGTGKSQGQQARSADPPPSRAPGPAASGVADDKAFEEGRRLAAAGRCREAIPYFDRAIQANSRHARAYSDRGRCLAMLGDLPRGLQDLDRAVQAAPNDKSPYFNRAGLRADAGDGEGALADLDRSIRLDPMNAASRAARAGLMEVSGRTAEARLDTETAYRQVDTLMSAKRPIVDQVLRTWRAKRARVPSPVAAGGGNPIAAATQAVSAGRDRLALATLDTALLGQPGNVALLAFRGRLHREIGQASQAAADLTAVLERAPSAQVYVERGRAYRQLCRFREEVAEYDQAVRLNPQFTLAYYERAFTTMFFDKRRDAIPDLTKVIQLDPQHWLAYNYRGDLNRYWFHLGPALADFQQAVRLNPTFAQAYCNGGFVLREARRMTESQQWLEKCFALDPSEREVARKEFAKIRVKEEQGARDLAAHMEWLRSRPQGGNTAFECKSNGGTWMVEKQASSGGWCWTN